MKNNIKTRYSIRFRDNDNELMKFASAQTNFTDSVRYLIEKEIFENGVRNLQEYIPSNRDNNYFQSHLKGDEKSE
jgi:hypothetical protein